MHTAKSGFDSFVYEINNTVQNMCTVHAVFFSNHTHFKINPKPKHISQYTEITTGLWRTVTTCFISRFRIMGIHRRTGRFGQ